MAIRRNLYLVAWLKMGSSHRGSPISDLGREYAVTEEVLRQAKLFAIQTIYKDHKIKSLSEARAEKVEADEE